MHGRKRDEYKAIHRDPNMVRKLSMKAIAWHTLQNELLQRQQKQNNNNLTADGIVRVATAVNDAGTGETATSSIQETVEGSSTGSSGSTQTDSAADFISTTLVLLEKAVTVNPDPIWLWNFRRTLVQKQLESLLSSTLVSSEVDVNVKKDSPSTPLLLSEQTRSIFEKEHGISQLGLQNNPKAYAVWHYRKWCIQQQAKMMMMLPSFVVVKSSSSSSSSSTTSDAVVWQLLNQELHLCNLLLQKDERNFHCWSYRRFVVSCFIFCIESKKQDTTTTTDTSMTGEWILPDIDREDNIIWMGAQITVRDVSMLPTTVSIDEHDMVNTTTPYSTTNNILQQEWEFTTTKIYENFSNFSAFHYRSKLLPLMIQIRRHSATAASINGSTDIASIPIESDACDVDESDITFQMIKDEFDLITNAIYTEPDDQTAWWYQVFLFHYLASNIFIQNDTNDMILLTQYNEQIIQPHLQQVRELQHETTNSSKWVLIGLLQCLEYMKKYRVLCNQTTADNVDEINQERRTVLSTLIIIDPDRKERYRYKLQQIR